MTYEIVIPTDYHLNDWFNIGIDFWPQTITANNIVTNEEKILVDLKKLAINLDNRYIKDYRIFQSENNLIIKVKV